MSAEEALIIAGDLVGKDKYEIAIALIEAEREILRKLVAMR